MVFLCSPNNPTGNSLKRDAILDICSSSPETLIVVDEAYIEFSSQESLADKIGEIQNLVVLKTLSKAYALAGVRGGAVLAHPPVIALLLKVLPPYPIARPVETAILNALAPSGYGCPRAAFGRDGSGKTTSVRWPYEFSICGNGLSVRHEFCIA